MHGGSHPIRSFNGDTSPKIQVVSSGGRQGHVNCESRIYQYRLKSKLPWIRRELANDQYKLVHDKICILIKL
jgi:hypothetical protein